MARCQFESRIPELTANLVKLYRLAEPADITDGFDWYPKARRIVAEWSTTYDYHTSAVACVIAAISPQCEWTRNLIIADDVLADRPVSIGGALHVNITKARRLRDDSSLLQLETGKRMVAVFPHGPKVTSFALNLAGNDSAVTMDGHAMQAALNNPRADYRLRWTPYLCFAQAYEAAAARLHVPSSTFQAVIWHVWKRLYPRMTKHAMRKQWEPIGDY